jgi:hypothetical protein
MPLEHISGSTIVIIASGSIDQPEGEIRVNKKYYWMCLSGIRQSGRLAYFSNPILRPFLAINK